MELKGHTAGVYHFTFSGDSKRYDVPNKLLKVCYKMASKVMQFQPRNLLLSSACSVILWMHTDDALKPFECMSVSFQCVWVWCGCGEFDKIMSVL